MYTWCKFQSHNGAIAAGEGVQVAAEQGAVSIPQWCDCCLNNLESLLSETGVSIPQWCDCCSSFKFSVEALPKVSIPQWCDCCVSNQQLAERKIQVSIPQWCDCCSSFLLRIVVSNLRFNPTMVRLLLFSQFFQIKTMIAVSIPQWCDCCMAWHRHHAIAIIMFQSHNGAIAAGLFARVKLPSTMFQSHNGAIAAMLIWAQFQ